MATHVDPTVIVRFGKGGLLYAPIYVTPEGVEVELPTVTRITHVVDAQNIDRVVIEMFAEYKVEYERDDTR